MHNKDHTLAALREMFGQWKELIGRLREPELVAPSHGGWSVKDILGHLRAWQQVSIARLEAAQLGREPVMPGWTAGGDPDHEPDLDANNARIHATYRDASWADVHRAWREGYLRLLALAEAIPDHDLYDHAKYPWLAGHTLLDVLRGTYEHHREHLDELI